MVSVILGRYLEAGQEIRELGHQMQMDYQLRGICARVECRPHLRSCSVQRLAEIRQNIVARKERGSFGKSDM